MQHHPAMRQVDVETVMRKFHVRRGDIQDLQARCAVLCHAHCGLPWSVLWSGHDSVWVAAC